MKQFLTCNITLLISAFTLDVNICEVLWKHQRTMPPLLNIVNKSNILRILIKF